jgi:hypothetical protein
MSFFDSIFKGIPAIFQPVSSQLDRINPLNTDVSPGLPTQIGSQPTSPSSSPTSTPTTTPTPTPAPIDNSGTSKSAIANAFNSVFGPSYYTDAGTAFKSQYDTPLQKDYNTELSRLNAAFGARGTTGSSFATAADNELSALLAKNENDYQNTFNNWQTGLQGNIASTESGLNARATASSDPTALGKEALSDANALNVGPNYSPVGDVFASLVNPIAGAGVAAPTGYINNALSYVPPKTASLAGPNGAPAAAATGTALAPVGNSSSVIG